MQIALKVNLKRSNIIMSKKKKKKKKIYSHIKNQDICDMQYQKYLQEKLVKNTKTN